VKSLWWTAVLCGVIAACASAGRPAVASSAAGSQIVFAANQLPHWYGEIYRVTPSGQRLDLTKSPASDIGPSVSPDGRWVAFLSGRGGEWAFYVVGSDGRGLHRVSRRTFAVVPNENPSVEIAWAPDSRRLAAEVGDANSAIYLGTRDGGLRRLARNVAVTPWTAALGWTPDGRMLAYSTADASVNVVGASGKRLWSVTGSIGPRAWSADDHLAVAANSTTIKTYDSRGRPVGGFEGASPTWDPHGTLLASSSTYAVQVRRNGAGTPILRWPTRNAGTLQWIDATTLRFEGPNGWVGVDVTQHKTSNLVIPDTPYNSVVSPSGRVLGEQRAPNNSGTLVLSTAGSTSTTTLASAPCPIDEGDFAGLAFMPRNLGVIYQTNCIVPSADIYSIDPDGTGLRRITDTPSDELDPSLSPDGQSIVYAQQVTAGKCEGCAQTLWRVPAAGGTPQQLTSHSDQDVAPFDITPIWSPDGSEIVFQRSGASAPLRLVMMPSNGGATRDLNAKGAAVPAWGPKLIAYADWSIPHLNVKTLDPSTGAVQTVATGGKTDVQALAWSNSGRLAYVYNDAKGHAFVAIVGSHTKPLDLSAHLPPQARAGGLAWSPDGTRFAFAATDRDGNGEIYTIAIDGSGLRQITHNIGALYNVGYQSTISWR